MCEDLEELFSRDHHRVMEALQEIDAACDPGDAGKIPRIAAELDRLLGPHFYFEENDLYPAAEKWLGEERVNELIEDHEPVAPVLERLKNLEGLSGEEAEGGKEKLQDLYIHVSDCEGLTVLIAAMRESRKEVLTSKFEEYRQEVGPLTSLSEREE